ncbi:MAG: oxidoreductase [Rhodospirillaceae bacterium]|nr:oxidoreductase [Rhodospirillaceae bacterium]
MADLEFGFVGLGRMGGPMVGRMLDRGYKVHVFDANPAAVDQAVAKGAGRCTSAADVASKAEAVFMSLPTPDIVKAVATGPDGIMHGDRVRTVVDFSTTGPRVATQVAAALAERNIASIDAPVSGGVAGAQNGTLAVMLSGPRAAIDELMEVLKTFGKPFVVGEGAGQAQTLKLANNLLAAAALAVTSEAMVMGVKAGLDPKIMIDVINAGSGRNSATQDKFPRSVLPGTFDFGFTTALSYKDVRLCIDEAEALGVPMVVGSAVRQFLAVTNAKEGPDSDFTSMCKVVEDWAGAKVRG